MPIRMVVGLGNPGKKYENTRHNVGYRVLDLLEKNKPAHVLLYRPEEFMNTVGPSLAATVRKKGYEWKDVLVICDDFSIPMPRLRIRLKGSSGGHNGLDSILKAAGSLEVPRLRAGIGPVPPETDPAEFVLAPFRKEENAALVITNAAEAVIEALQNGIEFAMNKFNTAAA